MATILIFLGGIIMMITERVLYLLEAVRLKLAMHYITVISGHLYVFILVPLTSYRKEITFAQSAHLQVQYSQLVSKLDHSASSGTYSTVQSVS